MDIRGHAHQGGEEEGLARFASGIKIRSRALPVLVPRVSVESAERSALAKLRLEGARVDLERLVAELDRLARTLHLQKADLRRRSSRVPSVISS